MLVVDVSDISDSVILTEGDRLSNYKYPDSVNSTVKLCKNFMGFDVCFVRIDIKNGNVDRFC